MKRWLPRLVIILHMGLALGYAGLWAKAATKDNFWQSDFSAYYTGWTILLNGKDAHNLYDLEVQKQYQQAILVEGEFQGGVLPYLNPPHTTLPFIPLALFPRATAFYLWSLGQFGLLVWLLILLGRITTMQAWSTLERGLLFTAVCAFPSLLITSMLGSFSLLMLVCTVQVYLGLKQQREQSAGVWMVIGSVKPQLMLMPGMIALAGRRWRVLLTATILGLLVFAISLIYPGWQSWQGFFVTLRFVGSLFDDLGIVPSLMWNVKGTLTLLLGSEHYVLINRASIAVLGGAFLVVFWLWRGTWQLSDARFDLKIALSLLLGLLCSPHLYPHDGLLLVLPAMLFYGYLRQRNLPRHAYAAFVLSCPLLFLVSEFSFGGNLGIRVPVVAMLMLGGWMAKEVWYQTDSGAGENGDYRAIETS